MAMKKVIGFLDVVDDVPDKATWLYSRKFQIPAEKSSGDIEVHIKRAEDGEYAQYIHYYEVDDGDFEALIEKEFFKMTVIERIKKFNTKNKLKIA